MELLRLANFDEFIKNLEDKIISAYSEGVTLGEAELLAGEFLYAQMQISKRLKSADLDARMRKSGLKAVKSAVRTEEVKKHDKKPTEGALDDVVNLNATVQTEQDSLDKAEVERDELQRYYDIFREAHIYMRGIAKGKLE